MDCAPAILLRAFANEDARHPLPSLDRTLVVQAVLSPPSFPATHPWRRNPPGIIPAFNPLLVSLRI
jgi:hypothetical protein